MNILRYAIAPCGAAAPSCVAASARALDAALSLDAARKMVTGCAEVILE